MAHSDIIFFNLFQFFCFFNILITAKSETLFVRKLSPSLKKLTHLSLYLHDILTAQHPTVAIVPQAASTNQSQSSFIAVVVFDDPLTMSPDPSSRLVGRAHGVYVLSLPDLSLTATINLAFTKGEDNRSTLSVLGQSRNLARLRELTVVGGTGVFQLVRGYIQVSTYSYDAKTKNAVLKYDVYLQHY
ncbi:dirigent protein 2-like [Rhodamnia argentea]|uniref:Dirigent protein n=1 Tax=Rhodamnia argentea TaxID=178133 RepID=A0A8B8N631_9MYRT|nr:dirigent protein 2-like [Rhodamnia argentea]